MEAKHFILPAAALVAAGVMLGLQRKGLSELRGGNAVLRERIAEARAAGDATEIAARPGLRTVPEGEAIDWEKLAEAFLLNSSSRPVDTVSIQRRLLAMDTPELLAALDRIAAMDLDAVTRLALENLILDPLAKKDPQAALERFRHRIGEPGFGSYLLGHALKQWAGTDIAAATAWMDREIAAGTFDPKSLAGKDHTRANFEAAIVFSLLGLDPAKAEQRLSQIPAAIRADILRAADSQKEMRMEDEIALAEIARRQLDQDGRVTFVGERATSVLLRGGDFEAVDEYLNSVYAAPDERERAAESVAQAFERVRGMDGGMKGGDIDALREWVQRDAPENADRITGGALARAVGNGMDFTEAAERAVGYRETSGDVEALHHFLSSLSPGTHNAEARKLAEKIPDPLSRDRLIRKFE
jgi:hypothetical protein